MKIIKNILIIIGAVLLLNYIVCLPMCVDDYIREESEVYSVQNAYRSSTLHKNSAHEIKQTMPPFLFALPLNRKDYIFDVTNNFYAIINISVYIWQFPRANISGIIAKKSELMFGSISHKPGIYCNVGGSCDREGYLWIIKRKLLRWLKNARIIIG
jgi:hypothetical protein|nr:MAG TPA: hypothetical protein [Caudoviricetes sp.]